MRQPSLFENSLLQPSEDRSGDEGATTFVPLSDLMAELPSGRPGGIARMAAAAETIDDRNGVEYRDLLCKTVFSRCDSSRVPFQFTVNPYRGCEFGCTYCLAPETPVLYA